MDLESVKPEPREEQQQWEKLPGQVINFSSGETMKVYRTDEEEGEDKALSMDLENMELEQREEQQQQMEKFPCRVINFSSGETMKVYSTDEEEGEDKARSIDLESVELEQREEHQQLEKFPCQVINFSSGETMKVYSTDEEEGEDKARGKDFESVELGELEQREEEQGKEEKLPRRIIHFSSGETMEEYSTDEEEGEDKEPERKDLLSSPVDAVRSKLKWGPYFWLHMWSAATSTISACDYLGEKMASFFGITSAKYQYAIDEYYRMKREREEEKEETRLSEEAEQSFNQLQCRGDEDEAVAATDRPEEEAEAEAAAARHHATYDVENEHRETRSTIVVPAIVTAT